MVNAHRTNGLRETVEAGDVALGVLDSTYSPNLVELYGDLGMDFVWIDPRTRRAESARRRRPGESAPGRRGTDTELLRPRPGVEPEHGPEVPRRGRAEPLFISQVESAEAVERAVSAAHFEVGDEPGRRGMANPRASRWGQAEDYAATEDEEVMVGVTIENQAAVDDLDAILDVPELGFVFLGPLDLLGFAWSPRRGGPPRGGGSRRDGPLEGRRRRRPGRQPRVRHGRRQREGREGLPDTQRPEVRRAR